MTLTVRRDGEVREIVVRPEYDAAAEADAGRLRLRLEPADLGAGDAAEPRRRLDVARHQPHRHRLRQPLRSGSSARKSPASSASARSPTKTIDIGAEESLLLLALVSLSLGLINLFPFLPLDGGHIFWSLVEKVRGQPVPFRVMERAGAIGFVLVIMLFFLGLTNDIGRLTGEGFNVR